MDAWTKNGFPITEVVRGTIIGKVSEKFPYAFFTEEGERITQTMLFKSDAEAIAWFKAGWPTAFKRGAEMRCWDQGGG
jgi:hypothetical protein